MPEQISKLTRFHNAYTKILDLQTKNRYLGAFIFGSVADGTSDENSDLDVKVIVDEDNSCTNINHPFIDEIKFDITFISLKQLKNATAVELEKGDRPPIILNSIIIFDKTNELQKLKDSVNNVKPKPYSKEDYQNIQFLVYHANNKVERFLKSDPQLSLFSMHMNIEYLLRTHYKLQNKWWRSDKKLIKDLNIWDQYLANILLKYVSESDVDAKFHYWSQIIDHILKPIGGRQPIVENNCNCSTCQKNLQNLSPD